MASIKSTQLTQTTDGDKRLAKVIFTPQVPNPAGQPDVEVVFEVRETEAIHLSSHRPYAVIGPLSCTRMDTRELYTLSNEQRDAVVEAVIIRAAEMDDPDWDD